MKLTKIVFALCLFALPVTITGCGSGGVTINEDAPVLTPEQETEYENQSGSGDDMDQN